MRHHLTLDANEAATEVFTKATTGSGLHRPWAVELRAGFGGTLDLAVAAPRATTVTFDLEVDAPTCFHADARYLAVVAKWAPSIDRSIATIATRPCGQPDEDGDDASKRWLRWSVRTSQPFGERRIATSAQRIDVPHGHFGRIEIDLASQISQVPADLSTVILVDASRSLTTVELEAQARLVDSYVRQAPGTQIQVIAFARTARALLPDWTLAARARPRLAHTLATLGLANGSNLDIAIVEANQWLARTTGTRRVIVLTDDLYAARVAGIQVAALRNALPPHTLVHVVALGGTGVGPRALARDDDLTFAQLAISTEGAAFRVTSNEDDALELLRPIALDKLVLRDTGWNEIEVEGGLARECSDGKLDLVEGTACVWWGDARSGAATLTLEGLLWNHRVSRVITPTGSPRTLARMLTGFGATLEKIAESEIRRAAEAVNEDWSLIATWGGSDGYGEEESNNTYSEICGCDRGAETGFGFARSPIDMQIPSVSVQIATATARCHLHGPVKLSLELTRDEIVDLSIEMVDPADRTCVSDAVWATPLQLAEAAPSHQTLQVTL